MKKFLGIVVLGLLLSGCSGYDYTDFKNEHPNFKYYAEACSTSDLKYKCNLAASMASQKSANTSAINECRKRFSNCVIHREGNYIVYNKQDIANKKKEFKMNAMITESKNTCKSLGFTEGTEKFTDCALKLYSQSIDLAAKNNQKIYGSPSGVMTIYDPVRDRQRMINQGMGMVMGKCNFGYNC